MIIIAEATSEPVSLELMRAQCSVDVDPTLDPPGSPHDPLLLTYLVGARERAELELGMTLAQTTVEITMDDFTSGADITLEGWPILESSPIAISYTDPTSLATIQVDESIYYLNVDDKTKTAVLRLHDKEAWPQAVSGYQAIQVQYDIGYSSEGESPQPARLPRTIMVAILLMGAHWFKNREETTSLNLAKIPLGASDLLSGKTRRIGFA